MLNQFPTLRSLSGTCGPVFGPSHAEGGYTFASASYSHAEGYATITKGRYSHAEGNSTQTVGEFSHAEGYWAQTLGSASHAEGRQTLASGSYSHAEGYQTISSGAYSHAEGDNTISIGQYSHAEGLETQTKANYSHAEGWGTIASGAYQHVQGQYNLPSTAQSAFIIGNGTLGSESNLVFASGSTFQISGSLIVSGAAESGGSGHLVTYNTSSGLFTYTASSAVVSPQLKSGSFGITLDGNGSVLTPGEKGYLAMPCSGTITNWAIAVDQTQGTSFTVNFYTSSFTEFGAGTSGSIQNLQLAASSRISSGTLSVPFTDKSVITFRVPSVSTTITRATVTINYIKS